MVHRAQLLAVPYPLNDGLLGGAGGRVAPLCAAARMGVSLFVFGAFTSAPVWVRGALRTERL